MAIIDALRGAKIALPSPSTIERAGIAGRARARKRSHEALLAGLDPAQVARLDGLVMVDPATESTRLTELRSIPTAPKPDNVRAILAKLAVVREIGISTGTATAIHPDRLSMLAREGRLSPTYLIERYTTSRRRATTVALLIDLEARLIDAALGMADRLIGQAFTPRVNAWTRREEVSFYISSVMLPAETFANAIRGHWAVENKNHWVRDITLSEDASRIRVNPGIMARLRSHTINIVRANGITNIAKALWHGAINPQVAFAYKGL